MPPPLIKAFGVLKKAAAQVNGTYGECFWKATHDVMRLAYIKMRMRRIPPRRDVWILTHIYLLLPSMPQN